jgi:hypothetical protein
LIEYATDNSTEKLTLRLENQAIVEDALQQGIEEDAVISFCGNFIPFVLDIDKINSSMMREYTTKIDTTGDDPAAKAWRMRNDKHSEPFWRDHIMFDSKWNYKKSLLQRRALMHAVNFFKHSWMFGMPELGKVYRDANGEPIEWRTVNLIIGNRLDIYGGEVLAGRIDADARAAMKADGIDDSAMVEAAENVRHGLNILEKQYWNIRDYYDNTDKSYLSEAMGYYLTYCAIQILHCDDDGYLESQCIEDIHSDIFNMLDTMMGLTHPA